MDGACCVPARVEAACCLHSAAFVLRSSRLQQMVKASVFVLLLHHGTDELNAESSSNVGSRRAHPPGRAYTEVHRNLPLVTQDLLEDLGIYKNLVLNVVG